MCVSSRCARAQGRFDLPEVTMEGDAITMTSPSRLGPLGGPTKGPSLLAGVVHAAIDFVVPLVLEVRPRARRGILMLF